MSDTFVGFGKSFQSKVIALLLTRKSYTQQIADILIPEYFDSEASQWLLTEILKYHGKYKKVPSLEVLSVEVNDIKVEVLRLAVIEALRDSHKYIESDDLNYVEDKSLEFCKNQCMKNAVMDSVDLVKSGDYDGVKSKIDEALKAGTSHDIGHDYKVEVHERYEENIRACIPTGWDVVDDILDGGLAQGELAVVVAPGGIGKSWLLVNIGAAALRAGKTVLHYTLELNAHYVGRRYDSVQTGIPSQKLKHHIETIEERLKEVPGELIIKHYPTKSIGISGLVGHIERSIMLGKKPDLVIVDYPDLMRLKKGHERKDLALEELYEELRGLAGEYEIPIWAASQAGKAALENEVIEADKIAGAYAKVFVSDFILSWSRKLEDKLKDTGRAHIIKNRFGPDGMTFPAKFVGDTGQVHLFEERSELGKVVKKEMSGDDIIRRTLASRMEQLND